MLFLGLSAALLAAGPAGATFPGRNGFVAAVGSGCSRVACPLVLVGPGVEFVGVGFHPAWSPDGKRLVYGEPHAIEIAMLDGLRLTGRRVLVRQQDRVRWVGNPAWSGDGRFVVYEHGEPSEGADLYEVRVADGRTFRLTHARRGWRNLDPAWSPDGRTIAYSACNPSGSRCGLGLMDPDGSHQRIVLSPPGSGPTREVIRPKWSPDGKKVGVTLFQDSAAILDVASHALRHVPGDDFEAWSPDGRRILVRVSGTFNGCTERLESMTESGKAVRYFPCGLDDADWQPATPRS